MTWAAWFLASLVLLVVSAPLFDLLNHGDLMLSVLLCVVLVLSVLAMESATRTRRLMLLFAAISIALQLAGALGREPLLVRFADAAALFLLILAAGSILHAIATAPAVDGDVILNAISAYLLLGVIWALAFQVIHQMDPAAFDFALRYADRSLTQYLYLSFMTLTTLGYGDVTSSNGFVRIWAVLESIVGVFFQAIVIARLVSVYRAST